MQLAKQDLSVLLTSQVGRLYRGLRNAYLHGSSCEDSREWGQVGENRLAPLVQARFTQMGFETDGDSLRSFTRIRSARRMSYTTWPLPKKERML